MRRKLTVNEQIRQLNDRQQAIRNKLRRLAPPGTIENTPTNDGTLLTWQSTWQNVSRATGCLDDLAHDSIIDDLVQAEKGLAAKATAVAMPLSTRSESPSVLEVPRA
jgi:type II secretory pathway component PulJ